jgi:hypothetical protein
MQRRADDDGIEVRPLSPTADDSARLDRLVGNVLATTTPTGSCDRICS